MNYLYEQIETNKNTVDNSYALSTNRKNLPVNLGLASNRGVLQLEGLDAITGVMDLITGGNNSYRNAGLN